MLHVYNAFNNNRRALMNVDGVEGGYVRSCVAFRMDPDQNEGYVNSAATR